MTSDHPVKRRKKLIEVAIPLEAINAASAREKSIRHGHPSTLHLWWARRPLAAARAVIFCQMVDDPSAVPEVFPTEEDQENERLRLFALISELVLWESTTNEEVLERARGEIRRSWRRCCADNTDHPEAAELFNPEKLPGFHDPFAGGGALPLEAQRLGLESYATDLNPVAVLINKAMIEIPPKFAGMPPVNPESRAKKDINSWTGAQGLAEDVRYYGKWMRDEAEKRFGHLYPKVKITHEMISDEANLRPDLKPYEGQELTVIAWIWARTVKSPSPSFSNAHVPLASTYMLGTKPGKEVYVEPLVDGQDYRFLVKKGKPDEPAKVKTGTKISRGANFRCLLSGSPISPEYIREQSRLKLMGARLMAVVAEGAKGRIYVPPSREIEDVARSAPDVTGPMGEFVYDARAFTPCIYGLQEWRSLFTSRQLYSISSLNALASEARELIRADAADVSAAESAQTKEPIATSCDTYSNAVFTYLCLAVSRLTDYSSSLTTWASNPQMEIARNTFARQALSMSWDYAETNPFGPSSGSYEILIEWIAKVLERFNQHIPGRASQQDAASPNGSNFSVISTDPPYYDNIPYADLSDFFYVWLRQPLKSVYPELFATIGVPKAAELVATAYRHGGKEEASNHFIQGMTKALSAISQECHPAYPVTIYYAFKQSESKGDGGIASTGWETFLEAAIQAGLQITATWPVRTEKPGRTRDNNSNALATSVVLACSKRSLDTPVLTRSQFRRDLVLTLGEAISKLETANIPPVDIAQSIIGPGMAIFSSARAILNPDDSAMTARDALIEINAALDENLSQEEGKLDPESRFALIFFESYGYQLRNYGDGERLAVARNISVEGVAKAGILRALAGKVQLLQRSDLPDNWDPATDKRICVWEATQQLIKRLEADGEGSAAALLVQLKEIPGHGDLAANSRALAYRLYNHCEKTKQAEEARSYNGLVIAWPELERQASAVANAQSAPHQPSLI